MAPGKELLAKKYFTLQEANASLPLVGSIVRDIAELARDLQERHERLSRVATEGSGMSPAYREEIEQARGEFERDQDRLHGFEDELRELGVELKDYNVGLIDFPCMMDNREVYLCWKLGEPTVAFWHELNAGFSGRQKIKAGERN